MRGALFGVPPPWIGIQTRLHPSPLWTSHGTLQLLNSCLKKSLTLTDERDFAMRDEINEGVKLKPRVTTAGNEQSRPSARNFFPFLFLLFFTLVLFSMSRVDWRGGWGWAF